MGTLPITDSVDSDTFLAEWRWKISDRHEVIGFTAFGDMFLADKFGCVWMLDILNAELLEVAKSREALAEVLDDPDAKDRFLLATLASDLNNRGLRLGPGKCYGYKLTPVLGGKNEVDNFYVADLCEYVSFHGDLHRQIKDLPSGSKVRLKVVE